MDSTGISTSNSQKPLFFICHASEDKVEFVKPLVNTLYDLGVPVFYDEYSIKLGDSIPEKISQGLAQSSHAVIVFSKALFSKNWPKEEIHSLFSKSLGDGTILIPIFHQVTAEEVRREFPLIANRKGLGSQDGVEAIAKHLRDLVLPSLVPPHLDCGQIPISVTEGFHIFFSRLILFPRVRPGCIFEAGFLNAGDGINFRIDLSGGRLSFTLRDSQFHACTASIRTSDWGEHYHSLALTAAPNLSELTIFVDGTVADCFQTVGLSFNSVVYHAKAMVGCSHDLMSSYPFALAGTSFGKFLDKAQVRNLYQIFEKFQTAVRGTPVKKNG